MSLLKGTKENSEVSTKIRAMIQQSGINRFSKVEFVGVFHHAGSMEDVRELQEKLSDPDSDYGDEEFVEEFFIRFEKMPAPDDIDEEYLDGKYLKFCDDTRDELLNNRDYFLALAAGCARAVFGTEGRRKN